MNGPYPENLTEIVNAIGFLITIVQDQQQAIEQLVARIDRIQTQYLVDSLRLV